MRNCGKAFAVVSDDMSQRDAKLALVIADKALAEMADEDPRPHRVFVVIPRDPEYGRYVRVEAWSGDGLEVYHCCRSASGRYGRPNLGGEITADRPAVVEDDGERREVPPYGSRPGEHTA